MDYDHPSIRDLIAARGWADLPRFDRVGAAYDVVPDEVAFGYNRDDAIPASTVLTDGFGQSNTKATLLMALLRALGVPCRLHGFTIHKALQRGVVPEVAYRIAPEEILHFWVEIEWDGRWVNLEGFTLDAAFLGVLQRKFAGRSSLCAYGAGTACLQAPDVIWSGGDTYIQRTGIARDLGLGTTATAKTSRLPRPTPIATWTDRALDRRDRGRAAGRRTSGRERSSLPPDFRATAG
nr:transglutaminase family protein [Jannaschia sp. Os4]